jgi:hypothetical protein
MKTKFLIWMATGVFLTAGTFSFAEEKTFTVAPTRLPDTDRSMKTPGFWIGLHPSPDQVILEPAKIEELNTQIQNNLKLTKDIAAFPETFSGEELAKTLRAKFEEIKGKGYFLHSGEAVSELFLQDVESNLNLTSVPSVIEPSFGFVLHYADQRFLPTADGLYEQPGDFDFDELQNNALEAATPVAIIHKSFDGQWLYVVGPSSDGWVMADQIVPCALKDIQDYQSQTSFAVVTKPKADLFSDDKLSKYYDYAQMGGRFPKEKKQEAASAVAVRVPTRRQDGRFAFQTYYFDKSDVSDGYLPYTPRTILKQAFALLNAPYGWGGMYGEQDCSRFLQEVFGSVGIRLPRDSKDQAKVGIPLAAFDEQTKDDEKLKAFGKAPGGTSILTLKGHIMLFLGSIDGKPYAIHAVWAYREPVGDDDRVRVIDRVAVSGLDLGEGSKKGSLLKRLTGIRMVSK